MDAPPPARSPRSPSSAPRISTGATSARLGSWPSAAVAMWMIIDVLTRVTARYPCRPFAGRLPGDPWSRRLHDFSGARCHARHPDAFASRCCSRRASNTSSSAKAPTANVSTRTSRRLLAIAQPRGTSAASPAALGSPSRRWTASDHSVGQISTASRLCFRYAELSRQRQSVPSWTRVAHHLPSRRSSAGKSQIRHPPALMHVFAAWRPATPPRGVGAQRLTLGL